MSSSDGNRIEVVYYAVCCCEMEKIRNFLNQVAQKYPTEMLNIAMVKKTLISNRVVITKHQ